jgi:hypothetical protein
LGKIRTEGIGGVRYEAIEHSPWSGTSHLGVFFVVINLM